MISTCLPSRGGRGGWWSAPCAFTIFLIFFFFCFLFPCPNLSSLFLDGTASFFIDIYSLSQHFLIFLCLASYFSSVSYSPVQICLLCFWMAPPPSLLISYSLMLHFLIFLNLASFSVFAPSFYITATR
jgi:hypothetical protein